jgi:hypothetical protein
MSSWPRRLPDIRRKRESMERERERRAELKATYTHLFDELAAAFFELDPAGINFETNTDEYELEVGTVLPRLPEARSAYDVEAILRFEFDRWFGLAQYDGGRTWGLAERVWAIWSRPGIR